MAEIHDNRVINVALLGHGRMGKILANNFVASELFNLVAVYDPAVERINLANCLNNNREPSITSADINSIFDLPQIDAIAIAAPVEQHFELAKLAISNNKHLLVEKPITATREQCQQLILLSKQNTKVLHVDHTLIYEEAVSEISQLLSEPSLGYVKKIISNRVQPFPKGANKDTFLCFDELAPHAFSLVDHFLPNSASSRCSVINSRGNPDHGIQQQLLIGEVEVDLNLSFDYSINASPIRELTIYTDNAQIYWNEIRDDSGKQLIKVQTANSDPNNSKIIKVGTELPIARMLKNWYNAITVSHDKSHYLTCAMRVMELMDGCKTAATSNGSGAPQKYNFSLSQSV